ncbi:MAG: PrsW family intramembrane metalloprotease [Alphaproteobacteria bacterium]|nr:PrsW family intramembrane metalloprotease [Alphaproteobacteria bacterium]
MELILVVLSTLCAAFPMALFVTLAWLSDRYDREPLWLVALTFFWGAIGAVLIALPLNTGFSMLVDAVIAPALGAAGFDENLARTMIGPTVGAPLFEEPAKALFFVFIAWHRRPHDMSSGFVYGAAAGLGFGMTENFLYFNSVSGNLEAWGMTVLIRTFYSALLHAMASSVVGAAFGFARLRGWLAILGSTAGGLAAAMLLHAMWNGLLSLDQFSPVDLKLTNFVLLPMEVLFVGFVYQMCLLDDALAIRRELEEEEDAGRLPTDHSWMLASWWRRKLTDIAPAGVSSDRYIRTATALARRKRQLRLLGERAPDFYRDDVRRLRKQLELLLKGPTATTPGGLEPG